MAFGQSKSVRLLKVVRLHIVLGGLLAFTLGVLLAVAAGGKFNPLTAILFYAIVFFGDLSTHYSNDYFDAASDRNAKSKKFFAGRRMLVVCPDLLSVARQTSLTLLSVSMALAALAVFFQVAPPTLLIIAAGANFLGWFYSAPPLRLASKGFGETAIALAAGLAIPAVGYLSVMGRLDWVFGGFALPFLLYGFMLGLSLQAPDVEVDRCSDKRNIGVRFGVGTVFGLAFGAAFGASVFLCVYALLFGGLGFLFWVAAAFSVVPLVAGAAGFIGALQRRRVEVLGAVNVCSLFGLNFIMIFYFVLLAV